MQVPNAGCGMPDALSPSLKKPERSETLGRPTKPRAEIGFWTGQDAKDRANTGCRMPVPEFTKQKENTNCASIP